MNDNRHDDRESALLADTVHDDWAAGRPAEFARCAAAHARRRRRMRRMLVPVAAAVAAIVTFPFFFRREVSPTSVTTTASVTSARSAATASLSQASPAFEIISDDELFANLRTCPVLILPDQPVERRYVVLDR